MRQLIVLHPLCKQFSRFTQRRGAKMADFRHSCANTFQLWQGYGENFPTFGGKHVVLHTGMAGFCC
ncbi:MAG: hypothetical protein ABI673_08000 [Novosphingobium sp.]